MDEANGSRKSQWSRRARAETLFFVSLGTFFLVLRLNRAARWAGAAAQAGTVATSAGPPHKKLARGGRIAGMASRAPSEMEC